MLPSSRKTVRKLVSAVGTALNIILKFDHFTSSKRSMITSIHGSLNNSKPLAIFATYTGRTMDKHDLEVLGLLRKHNFNICIVVNVSDSTIFNYSKLADLLIFRENLGHDLGAMRDALMTCGGSFERILLLNDSIIWKPKGFNDLLTYLGNFEDKNTLITLLNSPQRKQHVQSFFFFAGDKESSKNLRKTLSTMRNWKFKRSAVTFGEIPIYSNMQKLGSKIVPLIDYDSLVDDFISNPRDDQDWKLIRELLAAGVRLNPSQHFWRELSSHQFGCIKRSAIHSNPARLSSPPNANSVHEIL